VPVQKPMRYTFHETLFIVVWPRNWKFS
jgi:hypothetical protein